MKQNIIKRGIMVSMILMLMLAFVGAASAHDVTVSRTITPSTLGAGESFAVLLDINVTGTLGTSNLAAVVETYAETDWTISDISANPVFTEYVNGTPGQYEWSTGLNTLPLGTYQISYTMTVPSDEAVGDYTITGKYLDTDHPTPGVAVTGDTDVGIGLADLHIYPGDDFQSIVKNASEGSTIYWHAGNYTAPVYYLNYVELPDDVHIIGDGSDLVVLDGLTVRNVNNDPLLGLPPTGNNVIIEGLTVTGDQSGFSLGQSNNVTVRNCVLEGDSSSFGKDTMIENCEIIGDAAVYIYADFGTGVSVPGGVIIRNNVFKDCDSACMKIKDMVNLSITGNTFENVTSSSEIIYMRGNSNVELSNNLMKDVTASYGMYLNGNTNLVIKENTFENCALTDGNLYFSGDTNAILYLNNFINSAPYLYDGTGTLSWESSSAINYTYKGNSYSSVLGNYFAAAPGDDADDNGIIDTPVLLPLTEGPGTDNHSLFGTWQDGEIAPALPIADFTADVTSEYQFLTVQFTDLSLTRSSPPAPITWEWDFDNDGVVDSTEQNPQFNYTAAGIYNVSLTVTNAIGADIKTKTDYIEVMAPVLPTADFTANVTFGMPSLTVQFTDMSLNSDLSVFKTWEWDFDNDGIVDSTEQNPQFNYTDVGIYNVSLTVSNSVGSSTETKVEHIVVRYPKTSYVDDDGGYDFTSIQDALNFTLPGDEVFVYNGYYEAFIIDVSNVTVRAEGADVVTVDCTNGDIRVNEPKFTLDGVKVVNGYYGVRIYGQECVIRNCVFEGLTYYSGMKTSMNYCRFENNVFSNATSKYCTLYQRGDECVIVGNTFINNTGVGLRLYNTEGNVVTNNNFVSNAKGGIQTYGGDTNLTIYGNNFLGNDVVGKDNDAVHWNSTEPVEYIYKGVTYTGFLGNYWDRDSVYTGVDSDVNGIGDTSYTVLGSADNSPLMGAWDAATNTIEYTPHVLSFVPVADSVIEGQETEIQIMASAFPEGLSGYNLTVEIVDPTVAEIVGIEYPAWASITDNSSMPGSSIYLKAVDGGSVVQAGAEDVVLATLTVSGKEFGSTGLILAVEGLDDDSGTAIDALLSTGALEVTMTPIPGQEFSPQDLSGDGFYEDLTGDGTFGFVDVVAFFNDMEWIEANLPLECSDVNGNGRIDFDDVVKLFEMV